MRYLRQATGISLKEKQRNENVMRRLNIEPVLQFNKRQQIKWFGHLRKMLINSLPHTSYNELANGFKAK
jgi:hypothetical protein